MTTNALGPAFSKIARAETHIRHLEQAISIFFSTNPFRLVSEVNSACTEEVWSIAVDPVPNEINDIAADAVHNLRVPLDKMIAAVAIEPAYVKFPVGQNADNHKRAITNQSERIPPDVAQFLYETEVHPGGKDELLGAIHDLDIRDKHRALVIPTNLGFSESHHGSMRTFGGFPLRWGSRRGAHMVPAAHAYPGQWDMVAPRDDLRPIWRQDVVTGAGYLEFTAPVGDFEVMTTTPGAQVQADIRPSLSIGFSDIHGLEGVPIVEALVQMRDSVEKLLIAFQERFF